ncbi:ABC transporter ATP-binding/permase C-terminal domain protein [Candidatus Cyrtobacter comes]|uniref:ABC transporter ATP-binding/permase C-terminal domain protein n=1 Tax=Candidatus Cyrtobacter comes TaxID=675776 RepID=A0ABU5L7B6_9RICK|nr:ATP-binding cassette domain-containing protein [Candidatus Cyrtobacter comes]MDZ5762027.1 ABC transporter ATP-binding/permase C-terminal domain protein [Candidatus Cyrtobacter comes]
MLKTICGPLSPLISSIPTLIFSNYAAKKLNNSTALGEIPDLRWQINPFSHLPSVLQYLSFLETCDTLYTSSIFRELDSILTELHNAPYTKNQIQFEANNGSDTLYIKELYIGFNNKAPLINLHDLTFEKNKIYAISGPSGCGKSMLTSALMGCGIPVHDLQINGHVITSEDHYKAFMPQLTYITPFCTLREAIIGPGPHSESDHHLLKQILDTLDDNKSNSSECLSKRLDEFHNEWASNLSGGQKKKIDLIHIYYHTLKFYELENNKNKFGLIIMDEPFTGLDSNSLQIALYLVHDLSKSVTSQLL